MALKDVFNSEMADRGDGFSMESPTMLCHKQFVGDYAEMINCYDFLTRQMVMIGSYSVASNGRRGAAPLGTIPFSQIDREVLECMRDKLIELGGNPPELPSADAALAQSSHEATAARQRRMKERAINPPIPG
jgi:hypothetical protein